MDPLPDCSRTAGVLRRSVAVVVHPGEVRAAVEDDYHHFRVRVLHDGATVTAVESEQVRIPWSACAYADENWSRLIGAPIQERSSAIAAYAEMRHFCTHMFELAGVAVANAARGVPQRRYDMAVPYGTRRGEPARLWRDGELHLTWRTDGKVIEGPAPYAGTLVGPGFAAWAQNHLSADEGEAALALRRAVVISSGRTSNLDAVVHSHAGGGCYTTQPERAPQALRVIGSTEDFETRPEVLLRSDVDWLDARPDAGATC